MKESITVDQLATLIKEDSSLQLIDVRSPGEYATGHVPRALNIPLEEVESRIDDLGSGPIAILCQSGNRATMACNRLKAHHQTVLVVEGGTQAWIKAGGPVTEVVAGRWSLERQVRLIAGLLVLLGAILAATINPAWIYLPMLIGGGLTFAGLSNICGMALLLGKLPWNQPAKCSPHRIEARS